MAIWVLWCEKITSNTVGAHCVRPHWCFCYFNGRGDPSPTGWVGYFLWKCSRFACNMGIVLRKNISNTVGARFASPCLLQRYFYFERTTKGRPYEWVRSRFDSNSAIFYSSKLQFFDKGEKRYVLFEEFKQYNLRDKLNIDKLWFCKAKWSHKTTNSLFASLLIFYIFITLYARQAIKSFLRAFFQKSENFVFLTIR